MGIFRQFPYTNFHDMNMNEVLRFIKEMGESWVKFVKEWGDNVEEQIDIWLTNHPEYITTVLDHSISEIKLTEELATRTIKDYFTPQMFGAKADGVTDDTEAFKACQDLKYVIIPNGEYYLSEPVFLANVLENYGSYTNYEPLYKKTLNINMGNVTFGENINLPTANTYAEACVTINNQYYLVCRTPAGNIPYIAVYDSDLTFLRSRQLSATYGNANSMHTDGEKLYIDFDTGYHVTIDTDFTNETSYFNNIFRNIIPYNKTWYGVAFDSTGVNVTLLNGYDGGALEVHHIDTTTNPTLQSTSLIDGILYIPTIDARCFRFIDIATMTLLDEQPYMSVQEVESFFKDTNDGKVKVLGHFYGFVGIENFGTFEGEDYYKIKYVPIDGAQGGNYSILNNDRYNIYNITNGRQGGFGTDTCDLVMLKNGVFSLEKENNRIMAFTNGQWKTVGTYYPDKTIIPLTIGGVSLPTGMNLEFECGFVYVTCSAGGSAFSSATNGQVIGTIPEKFRPPNRTCYITGLAQVGNNIGVASKVIPILLGFGGDGNIKIWGNTADLKTCTWIEIWGTYPLNN